jgi:hypothetical protein
VDPSSYCGFGTLWSETEQKCVLNPSLGFDAFDGDSDGCIAVNDLLGLLAVFGECEPEGSTIYWFNDTNGWPFPQGNMTNESTVFYIQDCAIDSGYYTTQDIDVAMEMILTGPDSLVWCEDGTVYSVMRADSLTGVNAISNTEIPNQTLQFESNNNTVYVMIPQSFSENSLLLEQAFFTTNSCGGSIPFSSRRAVTVYDVAYWLYTRTAYDDLNVLCGY